MGLRKLLQTFLNRRIGDKMIALKRDTEIWKQSDWNNWVYEHLDWLTTPRPDGDGYELIEILDD